MQDSNPGTVIQAAGTPFSSSTPTPMLISKTTLPRVGIWLSDTHDLQCLKLRLPAHVLAVLLPIQLPADVPGKAAGSSPSTWAPTTHVGHLIDVQAPSFLLAPAPAVAVIWE